MIGEMGFQRIGFVCRQPGDMCHESLVEVQNISQVTGYISTSGLASGPNRPMRLFSGSTPLEPSLASAKLVRKEHQNCCLSALLP